ncbi:MAG: RluA family pseudouridine synthase [Chlamydiae bacterium]|nr:RluA family pseudouridine synthase [Chlamydiota bacterium]
MKRYRWKVSHKEHGMKLLPFLREKCEAYPSVKSLKRAIENKCCTIDGKVEFFSTHPLSKNQIIELRFSEEKQQRISPKILYEDEDLIIFDKPAGLITKLENFIEIGSNEEWQLVHRLDKETSGCLILAKNGKTGKKMGELFSLRKVKKGYLAIVDKKINQDEGTIDQYLVKKAEYDGGSIYGPSFIKKGKKAITNWKSLQKQPFASLIFCNPVTGRTHQIRAGFTSIGHPILGDWQYAKNFACKYQPKRHLLHAYELQFLHPISGKLITVHAPIPDDFLEALKILWLNAIDLNHQNLGNWGCDPILANPRSAKEELS